MSLTLLEIFGCVGVVLGAMALLLLATIDEPVGGADEGYLWYGVLEVAAGRVPIRDFRAYEPGRYWWSVVFHRFLGPGLWSMRIAATAALGLALAAMAVVLRGTEARWSTVVASTGLIAVWSLFPHKRFDQGVLLGVMAAAAWVLAAPSAASITVLGVMTGVAGVFGLNLGFYAGVTAGLVLVTSVRGPAVEVEDGLLLVVGVVVGSAPLWLALLFVRGLAPAMWRCRVVDVARRGSTNLPLPQPFPWSPPPRQITNVLGRTGSLTMRWLFVLVPAVALAALGPTVFGSTTWVGDHAVVAAAAVTTVPAWHHVVSRADLSHLTTVLPVPIVGILAAVDSNGAALVAGIVVVAAVSAVVALPRHHRRQRRLRPDDFVKRRIGPRSQIWLLRSRANQLDAVKRLTSQIEPGAPLVAIPGSMWLLPFVGRRSAVYETFCVYPASIDVQRQMIAEIEESRAPLAIVNVGGLDGRSDLCFPKTHPEVWSHIETTFTPARLIESVPNTIKILKRRVDEI